MTVHFDGVTYDPRLDHHRLTKQLDKVWYTMSDGEWRTLHEIALRTDAPESSVSARLRDLRKSKFGGYTVERKRWTQHGKGKGTWYYRVLSPTKEPSLF
jgi:hypothetical protein